MRRTLLLFPFSLFLASAPVAQVVGERLLPASVTREVATKWKQDGRVAEVEISNPKLSPVLTTVMLDLQYEALPPRAHTPATPQRKSPPKPPGASATIDLEAGERYLSEIEAMDSEQLNVLIQPGSKLKVQVELRPNRKLVRLTSVRLNVEQNQLLIAVGLLFVEVIGPQGALQLGFLEDGHRENL